MGCFLKMKRHTIVMLVSFISVILLLSGCGDKEGVANDDYPNKSITLIVPFASGGGTDAVARAVGNELSSELGVDVIIENREGGQGANGMNEGLNAEPDGYTLTIVTREAVSLPLLGTAPFETSEFNYVANVESDPAVLVVPEDSKYETLDDLTEEIKQNPGDLIFAASVMPNYYAIQYSEEADLDFITSPYDGAAPAIKDLLGGRADFGLYNPAEVESQVLGEELKPLAVMGDERVDLEGFEDTPTFEEEGLDIQSGSYRGIGVPSDTPQEVIETLEEAIKNITEDSEFIEFMDDSYLTIDYLNSEDFTEKVEEDEVELEPIIEIAKENDEDE